MKISIVIYIMEYIFSDKLVQAMCYWPKCELDTQLIPN